MRLAGVIICRCFCVLDGTLWGPLAEYGLHCLVTRASFSAIPAAWTTRRDIYPRFQRCVESSALRKPDGLLRCGEERVEHFFGSRTAWWEPRDHKCAFTIRAIWD